MIRALALASVVMIGTLAYGARAAADSETVVTLNATPREVRVGETFVLEVRADVKGGSLEELTLSDLKKYPELSVVSHRTSRPMQVSFGFGSGMQVASSLSHQYVMRASAPGTFSFSPAVAKVDGKTYRSDPLTVVALPANGSSGTAAVVPTPPSAAADELSGAQYDSRAFLRTVVEPQSVYIGQQVDLSVYLYTRAGVAGRSVNPSKPSMNGFWVYDEQITNLDGSLVTVNGAQYRAYLLQKSAAFPQRTGQLTIGAPRVEFDIGPVSFFDAPERVERTGVPVVVNVKPLPEPGPANAFVGKYTLRAQLDRATVRTGNAVTLSIEAAGVGNVQDLRIQLPPISGVRALQPVVKDRQHFSGKLLAGIRTWEWILIAETPGAHSVPSISIDYFDPETAKYRSASTRPLTFSSTGVAAPTQPTVSAVVPPTQPEAAAFGPIRMYSALSRAAIPVRERAAFAWLLALPPTLFVMFILGLSLARRRSRRKATTAAVQRRLIHEAHDALRDDDPRTFYDRIVASIAHALVTRTTEPVRGLSNAELRTRLVAVGLDDDLVQRVINELEGADFARFAASGVNTEEMERCLQRTEAIVERIHRTKGRT